MRGGRISRRAALLAVMALASGVSGAALGTGAAREGAAAAPSVVALKAGLAVGDPAPPLKLQDLSGVGHSLDEWRGRVLLVNFWAAWCAPCQYEIRDLIRYQHEYGARGLQVLGVGMDETRKLANVVRSLEVDYPVLAGGELNPSLLGRWGDDKGTIPYTVVIDRSGQVRYLHKGPFGDEAFEEAVLPLLE